MPAAAWVTLVITALIIAAAALGLLRVIFHLRPSADRCGTVIGGVQVVAHQTRTVPEVLPSVTPTSSPSATSANRSEEVHRMYAAAPSPNTGWVDRLHHHGSSSSLVVVALVVPILVLAASIGKEAKMINDSLTAVGAQHRRAQGAEHHDRPRRGHRRRACAAAVPARRLSMVTGSDRSTQENLWWGAIIGGVRHRARGRRAADDPGRPGAPHRQARGRGARHPAGRGGQHRRHRPDRRDRRAVDAVLAEGLKHHLFLGRVLER